MPPLRNVHASNALPWFAQPVQRGGPGDVRQAAHDHPATWVEGGRANSNQHVMLAHLWHVDLTELEHLDRTVS
jgi:hypothetical protein